MKIGNILICNMLNHDKKISTLFILLSFVLFTQCSIGTDIYVQNLTSTTVKFKIFYKRPLSALSFYKKNQFVYAERIVNPKMFKQEIMKDLKFQKLSDSAIVLELPKLSTTRIEQTSNTNYYRYLDYIEYNGKKLELEDFVAIADRKGPHIVYTIKPRRSYD
jgi:hypothetical protein